MNSKRVITIIVVLAIVFTILGGSLAYWSWASTNAQKTNVTFTVGATFSCSANGGGNITASNYFAPTDCDNATYAVKREITVNTTSTTTNEIINLSMDLNISNISSALLQTDYFKYALTKNANTCSGAISGGSFKDNYDSVNHTVPLLVDEEFIGTESKTYYLYIWLDKDETDPSTMNTSFSASLEGSCTDSGNILNKVYVNLGGNTSYFKTFAYYDNITSVSFVNEINIPANAVNQWDVGVSPSNTSDAKAWLEDDGNGNNKFALKIGANGTIFATNLSRALDNLKNVGNFNFSALNTSETTDMSGMFYNTGRNASAFTLNLGNKFDTSNVINMSNMFGSTGSSSTTFNLDLGNNFNTSKVTDMSFMFNYTGLSNGVFNLNLGDQFDTSNVTNMSMLFYATCHNCSTINLGNQFNTSKVTNMVYMFADVGRYSTNFSLNLGNKFNTSKVTNMHAMFMTTGENSTNWSLNLGNQFDTSNVTSMAVMFDGVSSNTSTFNLNLGNKFNTAKVTDMRDMFTNAGKKANIFTLDLGDFNTSNVTDMSWMFGRVGQGASTFNLNLGNQFNTSKVTNMANMFYWTGYNATNFNLILGNQFNTSNVRIMFDAFYLTGSKAQTNFDLDLSAGNFTNVTNNTGMFYNFGNNKATIYVKDATAQSWVIAQNSNFNASNVLIK